MEILKYLLPVLYYYTILNPIVCYLFLVFFGSCVIGTEEATVLLFCGGRCVATAHKTPLSLMSQPLCVVLLMAACESVDYSVQ